MKNSNYIVYKHTCPNGKIYIGLTCTNPKEKWYQGRAYIPNKSFYKDIQHYGWDNVRHEIVYEDLDRERAFQLKHDLISLYQTENPEYGYNNAKFKPIRVFDVTTGKFLMRFDSVKACVEYFHVDQAAVSNCLLRKSKSFNKKYTARYE